MNFTLKNWPKDGTISMKDEWVEGFEKELREKIDLYSPEIGWIRIKEILGE